jgi:hypothetical protein
MENLKTELKQLLQEFKDGKASVFDRKNTSITFRCSMQLKAWIHEQAATNGFESATAYLENCLTVLAQGGQKKPMLDTKAIKLEMLENLEEEYKSVIVGFEKLTAMRQTIKEICKKARASQAKPAAYREYLLDFIEDIELNL